MGRVSSARRKRAQISMEYLMVIGISIMMAIPLTVIFLNQHQNFEDDIKATHLEKVANELVDAAEEVFYLGPPTQKKLRLYFPEDLQSVSITSQSIEFVIDFNNQDHSYFVDSTLPLNMTGSIRTFPGPHTIVVSALDTGVNISDVS